MCREAAWQPVRELKKEELESFPAEKLRPVKHTDLVAALQKIKASSSGRNRRELEFFAEKYAQTTG